MREGMLLVTRRRPITLSQSHRIALQLLLRHILKICFLLLFFFLQELMKPTDRGARQSAAETQEETGG